MPQKVIKFAGINRKVNEFQSAGACEELINMRPTTNGLVTVRPKKITHTNDSYRKIYEHTFGDVYNQIVVTTGGSIEWINPEGGNVKTITNDFKSDDVNITTAGNILMAYSESENKQLVFRFKDREYESFNVTSTRISASLDYRDNGGGSAGRSESGSHYVNGEITADAYNRALESAFSMFYKNNKTGLCGAAVIGCTYELEDGSEVWSTAFIVANADRSGLSGYKEPEYKYVSGNCVATIYGSQNVYLSLKHGALPEEIKKINIYASRPVLQFECLKDYNGNYYNRKKLLDDVNIAGQIMYYRGSVYPKDGGENFNVTFPPEMVGEQLMDVTSGCIDRVGPAISYNNRFHFYHSDVYHVIQSPTVSTPANVGEPWIAYVNFEDKWKLIDKIYSFGRTDAQDFIYPMGGIKQIAFVRADVNGGEVSPDYNTVFFVNLKDSSSYNYSYSFDHVPSIEADSSAFKAAITADGQLWGNGTDERVLMKKENNVVNVSVPMNPFAFTIKGSYSFSGEILDIKPSYVSISSTQLGQYPLNVFTSNGIFALEQGDGSVLYSNITPLQPLVIQGEATPTPFGTFFISSKALYVLHGRDVANASAIVNGEVEYKLREQDAYKKLCCTARGTTYDFLPLLSKEDFEQFISDSSMTYDQLNNELCISSNDSSIPYSYVFNIDTKHYHKISKKYICSQSGSRYAIEATGTTRRVVDLHMEEKASQPILMQSRPMSLEVLYTHIHRMILMLDATLEDDQYLFFSVFGSDNLNDWKCIISSQKHDTVLRQIRTNRAAKSYKDYIFIINGVVDSNTDLSDIIVDYTVVNRRLG